MKMCIAAMKNMTTAQKGKAALTSAGISCEIINLDPMITKNGCAYGISFPCRQKQELLRIFRQKKIAYGEILGVRE